MAMNPVNATITTTGTSVFGVDWRDTPNGVSYQVVFNAGASGSVTVDTTLDNVNGAGVTPVWTTGSAVTSTTVGTIGAPVQFVRLSVNSLSGGTLSFKLLEGAPDNGSSTGGGGGGSTSNVNIAQVGGNAVTTSIPVSSPTSSTATPTQVPASASAVTLLAANSARLGATIFYNGAATLYLLEGAGTPTSAVYTTQLGQSAFWQYDAPAGFTGAIKGIWSSTVGSADVTERTA